MRLILKDSERRPDPAPVKTDDRKAMLVGLAMWVVALVALVLVPAWQGEREWLVWTCVAGIVLGLIGLLYVQLRRR